MKHGSLQVRAGRIGKEFDRLVNRKTSADLVSRIMHRDPTVYSTKPQVKKQIGNRLGWVDIASSMKSRIGQIEKFGSQVLADGIVHIVLIGMGGSSLCPEVFRFFFRRHKLLKSYDVLDSTDPEAVRAIARKIDLKRTLFVVASKSGGTVETRSHEAFFIGRLQDADIADFGRHFAVITDKGSPLEQFARRNKYRKIFLNPPDIGGRYSALSYFGLVPAFFAGVDLNRLVNDAAAMEKILRERKGETNPALLLGALMAAAAASGRDKLTFFASRRTGALVPWIEQLIAESTGKNGKGVIPIENEPVGPIQNYGDDRVFVIMRMERENEPITKGFWRDIKEAAIPTIEITLGSKFELGRQFLLWEAATAAVGQMLKVNPFDEPNVTESKENTKLILAGYERIGTLPDRKTTVASWGTLTLVAADDVLLSEAPPQASDIKAVLKRFFRGVSDPAYLAILNYFRCNKASEVALEKIRNLVRNKTRMATTRGYGPRYLHSIGQLYKGGPKDGLFLVFVRGSYKHLPIPGKPFGFDQLIDAQAIGDAQALIKRKYPTLVIALNGKPADGLEHFAKVIRSVL